MDSVVFTPTVCPLCLSSHYEEILTLPCAHIFCKRCLTRRLDGNILMCPTCSKRIDLGDHGLEGLMNNYLIRNLVDLVSSTDDNMPELPSAMQQWSANNASPLCQSCEDDHPPANTFCNTCEKYLCTSCTISHQRAGRDHEVVSAVVNDNSSHPRYCSEHKNQVLSLCCNVCLQPVCGECIRMPAHIGHNIVRLDDAARDMHILMPAIVSDLKVKRDTVNNLLTQVNQTITDVQTRAQSVSNDVHACIRQNITALEEKEKDLLAQIDSIRNLKCEILHSQKDDLNKVKNHLADAVSLVMTAYNEANTSDLVNIRRHLKTSVAQIQVLLSHLTQMHDDDKLGFCLRDLPLRTAISQIGTVTSSSSALHTTASGHGVHCAIVGKRARFQVTCRNHANQKLCQSNEQIDVTILNQEGKPQPAEMIRQHDGIYQFSYFPSALGAYEISILLRGHHIAGSPMMVKVRSRRNYYNIGTSHLNIGSEGDRDDSLCRPWGVCCDSKGHIIVADRSNNRVQVFNSDGTPSHRFGTSGTGPGQFDRPAGITINSHNHIIVADKDNHRIQVFTFEGKFLLMFGERGNLNGQLHYPWDVACNNEDCILVSDTRNHRIQLYSPQGQFLNKFNLHGPPQQKQQPPQPRGLCFTENGDILVTDFNKHKLIVIRSNFQSLQMLGSEGQGNGQFFRPNGVAVDLEGNILVTEGRNNRVQIFRPDGNFLTKFGSAGTGPSQFDRPSGIAVTPDGYIVVVDFGNNRVQFF